MLPVLWRVWRIDLSVVELRLPRRGNLILELHFALTRLPRFTRNDGVGFSVFENGTVLRFDAAI